MGGRLGSGGSGYGFGYGSGPLQTAGGGVGVFSGRVGPDAADISVSQSTGDLRFLESSQGVSKQASNRLTTQTVNQKEIVPWIILATGRLLAAHRVSLYI